MTKTKQEIIWDLNLFYKEDYNVDTDETTWEDVLTINPSIYEIDEYGGTMHHFTDIIIKTTFAEARYINTVRPGIEYGSDWFEFCDEFMEVAPPRIKSLLNALPDANEYFERLAS